MTTKYDLDRFNTIKDLEALPGIKSAELDENTSKYELS